MLHSVRISAAAASLVAAAAAGIISYVDTRIGSGGEGFGIGGINPGSQLPFGALKLGPDTTFIDPVWGQFWFRWNHFGGAYYNDTHISAFSHTHMVGPGASDFGDFGIMVSRYMNSSTIADSATQNGYRSGFSHDNETAQPGYYAVHLADAATYAELTASGTHSGMHRYTCEGGAVGTPCYLLMDACHTAIQPPACPSASVAFTTDSSQPGAVILTGTVLQAGDLSRRGPLGGVYVYIYAVVTAAHSNGSAIPPVTSALWSNNTFLPGSVTNASSTSGNLGVYVSFPAATVTDAVVISVRVGISFVSPASARNNLYVQQQVNGTWPTFDVIRASAQSTWETALGRVAVTPPSDMPSDQVSGNLTVFYSAVYRTLMAPTIYSEADGRYLGMDGAPHTVPNGTQRHSDMSIWDIHRSEAPWLAFFVPNVARDITNSLLAMTAEGGHLPRWPLANVYTGCMDGSHAVEVMTDAVISGIPGVNASAVYAVVAAAIAMQDAGGTYIPFGYITSESSNTAASSTLEYAYDDGIAAVLAGFMGDAASQAVYANRSQFYRNLFDPSQQLMCPRSQTGAFACPPLPLLPYPIVDGYTEGDAVQYQTFVPHDQWGMFSLYNSSDAYVNALQTLQSNQTLWPFGNFLPNAWYWAGNEPDLLAPWQFPVAGNEYAFLTQYWTRWLLNEYYTPRADGIPGNDDFGTMSAWTVWAYVGLYPLTGTGMYVLGSPTFANMTITLPPPNSNVALTVIAHNASANNVYVASAVINGVQLATPYVNRSQLLPGFYRPDCESVAAHGHLERSSACSTYDMAAAAPAQSTLELWMTDVPVTFGSGQHSPAASGFVPSAHRTMREQPVAYASFVAAIASGQQEPMPERPLTFGAGAHVYSAAARQEHTAYAALLRTA